MSKFALESGATRAGAVWMKIEQHNPPISSDREYTMNMRDCQICAAGLALPACMAILYNGPLANMLLLSGVVGFLLLLVALLIWSAVRTGYLWVPLSWPVAIMALWFGWLLVSSLWSYFPQMSWDYAWTIGAFPLLFIIWLFQANSGEKWRRAFPWLLGVALLAAMEGIIQYMLTQTRVAGPMLDFNSYGALLYLFILALLPLCFNKKRADKQALRRHWLLLGSFAFLCLALFATYSRGAIGILTLLCVPFYFFARRRYPGARKTALVLLLIAVSCYGAVKIYPRHTIDRRWDLAQDSSFQSRLMMWHSMLKIYKQHPWLGTGIATYKLLYHQVRSPAEDSSSGDLGHNDYIQFLQEQGPAGLAFLLATGLLALSVSWRLFRRRDEIDDFLEGGDSVGQAFGLSLGVLGLFMHAGVNFIFYVQPLSLLGGLFLAHAYRIAQPVTYRSVRMPKVSRPVLVLALIGVCGLPVGGLFLDGVIATVLLNQGNWPGIREVSNDPTAVYQFAVFMRKLRPYNIDPRAIMAQHELSVALDESNPYLTRVAAAHSAERAYTAILKAQSGYNAPALSGVAQLVTVFPGITRGKQQTRPARPDALLRRAIKYDPTYFPAYTLLAKRDEAEGEVREALDLIVNQAFRWFAVPVPGGQRQRIKLMEEAVKLAARLREGHRTRMLARQLLEKDPHNAIATKALSPTAQHVSQSTT